METVDAILEFYYRILATPPFGSIVFFIKILSFIVVALCIVGTHVFHARMHHVMEGFHMRRPTDSD